MACNFYEGYLMHVIPSDGANFGGFIQNVQAFEAREGIVVPVRKLFIIITKSMYSPPDLQLFNKENRPDLSKLESCSVRIGDYSKVRHILTKCSVNCRGWRLNKLTNLSLLHSFLL